MIKRSYIVYGKDATGTAVQLDIKAKTALQAIEQANNLNDGNRYESAKKRGCNCGSR